MTYAYNADTYCDDCAAKIVEACDNEGCEDTGDTNDYPQYCFSNECDYPDHCADCDEFLENDITTDGVDYIKERYADDPDAYQEYVDFYGIEVDPVTIGLEMTVDEVDSEVVVVRDEFGRKHTFYRDDS